MEKRARQTGGRPEMPKERDFRPGVKVLDRKTPIGFGNKPAAILQISVSGRCRRSPRKVGWR